MAVVIIMAAKEEVKLSKAQEGLLKNEVAQDFHSWPRWSCPLCNHRLTVSFLKLLAT